METKTKSKIASNKMYSLLVLYDMHTKYFSNVIEGISDQDAHNRMDTKANHVAWLAGSLVHERFALAKAFVIDRKSVTDELFKGHKGIQDDLTYPSLASYKKDWKIISPILRDILVNVTDEKLEDTIKMENMSMSYFDYVTFQTYREASCIGQIALYRRLLGYKAMKYE